MDKQKTIFMLMAFRDNLTEIYKNYIKTPLEEKGYNIKRADDFYLSTDILIDILRSIEKSDIIIADLTTKNANVFYELGYAHHVRMEKVILISQESKNPFDVGSKRTIIYTPDTEGLKKLKTELIKFVIAVENEISKTSKKKVPIPERSDREFINLIKDDEFENESDFIIETSGNRLNILINLIIGEFITIEWDQMEKRIQMERLLCFIEHVLALTKDPAYLHHIIRNIISSLPIILNRAHGEIYYMYTIHFLEIPHIFNYVKTNQEIISTLVNTFCNSQTFNEARVGIDILNLISDSLNKKSWLKIIESSLENDQIYNAGGILDNLYSLIKREKIKLNSKMVSKIKESAEQTKSEDIKRFYYLLLSLL